MHLYQCVIYSITAENMEKLQHTNYNDDTTNLMKALV